MKIKFLGTGAAEGIPALFCTCDNCKHAREHKGKNIRTRFSILIDESYKIDFPPDSYLHMLRYNLDYTKLKYIFITHDHHDHIAEDEFAMMMEYFTNERNLKINILGNNQIVNMVKKMFWNENAINMPQLIELKSFDKIETKDYTVTALPADHDSRGESLIYFFEEKESAKTFLCAHDTGYFDESVWNFLKGKTLDIISLDGTALCFNQTKNHLGFDGIFLVKKRLLEEGIINENTKFIINHFSHNPQMNHEQIEKFVEGKNIIVAYDGMEITL
jgi:phosphoribosyl 1,2-cyclic phosphate phosphodiesterase